MAADDLNAPLGQKTPRKRSTRLPAIVPQALAAILGLFVLAFVLWTAIADDPLGGEPRTVVSALPPAAESKKAEPPASAPANSADAKTTPGPGRYDGPPASSPQEAATKTITIIDGSSGKKQEVVIAAAPEGKPAAPLDSRLVEKSRHGPVPVVAPDGTRAADAYASASKTAAGNPDAPRIALIIGGLGVGANGTAEALSKMPAPVTLAFAPYGQDLDNLVARARGAGHEVLLQVPMEPFDYPDNDPGPQTLLTSLSAEQNIDRLHWLLSRFQGYVGVTNFMGARFTASEQAIGPVLRETAKRGLVYVDDGSSPRSLTSQIAGANKLAFAKAELVIDSVPTAKDIDKALARLEAHARERGLAVGTGQALPVTIDRVSKWAKAAAARGVVLVPISAVALKAKSS